MNGNNKILPVKHAKFVISAALLTAVLFTVFFVAPVMAAPGLNVEGASCVQAVDPGNSYVHTITITNTSPSALDLLVDRMGFGQSNDGSYVALDPAHDASPYSALSYITSIDNPSFHLESGASAVVNAKIQVPDTASSGIRYAMIYIHTLPSGNGQVGIIVGINIPVVIMVNTTNANIQPTGEISTLTIGEIKAGQPLKIYTAFKNTGDGYYKVKNQVNIINNKGQIVSTATTDVTASSIFPTFSHLFEVIPPLPDVINGLPAGTYTVDSRILLNDGTLIDDKNSSFVIDESYKLSPGLDKDSIVIASFDNQVPSGTIDAVKKADTEVTLNDTGVISGSLDIGKYTTEPQVAIAFSSPAGEGGAGETAIKYIDVRAVGFSKGTATVSVHFSGDDIKNINPDTIFLAYFDGSWWHKLDNLHVYSQAGYVTGNIPVAALTGTVIALGGAPAGTNPPQNDTSNISGQVTKPADVTSINPTKTASQPGVTTSNNPTTTKNPVNIVPHARTSNGFNWVMVIIILGVILVGGTTVIALITRKPGKNLKKRGKSDK